MILHPGDLILFDLSEDNIGFNFRIGKGSLLVLEDDIDRAMYHGICSNTLNTSFPYIFMNILLRRAKCVVYDVDGAIRIAKGSNSERFE
tara:strand:- start:5 stop:271 length:267 start_codon:yes stop_codon:yes gene_type:complete